MSSWLLSAVGRTARNPGGRLALAVLLTLGAALALEGAERLPEGGDDWYPAPVLRGPLVRALGERIWRNEGAGRPEYLTWWNAGEGFASLGIGHFIWYPRGVRGRFRESFPALVEHLAASGAAVPGWLRSAARRGCPWPDRGAFIAAREDPRMLELRALLASTVAEQARFIAERMLRALPRIVAAGEPAGRTHLRSRIDELVATEQGLYALTDYANFKGEGTDPSERYRGEGWGLAQVLAAMAASGGSPATARFAEAARGVLRRRIDNAPPERGEGRWLPGWMARIDTY